MHVKSEDILSQIIQRKSTEVAAKSEILPIEDLIVKVNALTHASPVVALRPFRQTLESAIAQKNNSVIAELKKASPSKGLIREDFDVEYLAQRYTAGGARCLSVLTDTDFFQGADEYIAKVKQVTELPVLRKDFIITPYQVYESRLLGADAILLIVAALDDNQFHELFVLARSLNLDVLIEVHSLAEYQRVASYQADAVLGVNNRNLKTFAVDLAISQSIQDYMCLHRPCENPWLITESGIHTPDHVQKMNQRGIFGFLVGESLMRYNDPAEGLAELFELPLN